MRTLPANALLAIVGIAVDDWTHDQLVERAWARRLAQPVDVA